MEEMVESELEMDVDVGCLEMGNMEIMLKGD